MRTHCADACGTWVSLFLPISSSQAGACGDEITVEKQYLPVAGPWELKFGNANDDPSSNRLCALWSQKCSESDFNSISLFLFLSCL